MLRKELVPVLVIVILALPPLAGAAPDEARVPLTGAPVGDVDVAAGGRVTFSADEGDHEIVAADGSWSTGPIPEGSEAAVRFLSSGEYAFQCAVHANLTGTVRVAANDEEPDDDDKSDDDKGKPGDKAEPPTVRILAPGDGATVQGEVTVHVAAEDPEGEPLGVLVRARGEAWHEATPQGGNTWAWTWDASRAGAGEHVLEAKAVAGARESRVAEVRVVVEGERDPADHDDPPPEPSREEPVVEIRRPRGGDVLKEHAVVVEGIAHHPGGRDVTVEVAIDDGPWVPADGGREWTFFWRVDDLAPGAHTVHARAFDGERHSRVASVDVVIPEDGDDFRLPQPDWPGTASGSGDWWRVAQDVGKAAATVLVLVAAWAWASSRP